MLETEPEDVIIDFYDNLVNNQQELEPEIAEAIYDKLWEFYLEQYK